MAQTTAPAFGRLKEILWPLGGTVLGLIAIPVAIAQYPEFFNNNRYLLPLSVGVVITCWSVPLLIHENAVRILKWSWSGGLTAKVMTILTISALISCLFFGGRKLFRFHEAHLTAALAPKSSPPVPSSPPRETQKPTPGSSPAPPPPIEMRNSFTVYSFYSTIETHPWIGPMYMNPENFTKEGARADMMMYGEEGKFRPGEDIRAFVSGLIQHCILREAESITTGTRSESFIAGQGSKATLTPPLVVPDATSRTVDKLLLLPPNDRFLKTEWLRRMTITVPRGTKNLFLKADF